MVPQEFTPPTLMSRHLAGWIYKSHNLQSEETYIQEEDSCTLKGKLEDTREIYTIKTDVNEKYTNIYFIYIIRNYQAKVYNRKFVV